MSKAPTTQQGGCWSAAPIHTRAARNMQVSATNWMTTISSRSLPGDIVSFLPYFDLFTHESRQRHWQTNPSGEERGVSGGTRWIRSLPTSRMSHAVWVLSERENLNCLINFPCDNTGRPDNAYNCTKCTPSCLAKYFYSNLFCQKKIR